MAQKTYNETVLGIEWKIVIDTNWYHIPFILAAATTYGKTTLFEVGLVPNAVALAHEYHHVLTTSWLRYVISYTIGKLWGSTYWKDEEISANAYGLANAGNPVFQAISDKIKADFPSYPVVNINHPVS